MCAWWVVGTAKVERWQRGQRSLVILSFEVLEGVRGLLKACRLLLTWSIDLGTKRVGCADLSRVLFVERGCGRGKGDYVSESGKNLCLESTNLLPCKVADRRSSK